MVVVISARLVVRPRRGENTSWKAVPLENATEHVARISRSPLRGASLPLFELPATGANSTTTAHQSTVHANPVPCSSSARSAHPNPSRHCPSNGSLLQQEEGADPRRRLVHSLLPIPRPSSAVRSPERSQQERQHHLRCAILPRSTALRPSLARRTRVRSHSPTRVAPSAAALQPDAVRAGEGAAIRWVPKREA